MADEILKRDQNFVTVLAGVTNDSDQDVTMLRVDPITKRLLVSASATGIGTVTSVSVVSANGFAGTVATATTTPAITLSTTVTGLLKGNGTAISAAVANTDYQSPVTLTTTGTSGAATFNGTTLNIPQYQAAGSYVTSVSGTLNRITSTGGTTPVIDISASYVGQTSITTLGTITTGVWNGTTIAVANGGTGNTSFTAGSVIFSNGTILTQDNTNFFFNNTVKQLRVGSATIADATATNPITIGGTSAASYLALYVQNLSSTGSSDIVVGNNSDNGNVVTGTYGNFGINGSTKSGPGIIDTAGDAYLFNNLEDLKVGTMTAGKTIDFFTNGGSGTASARTRATINDTGLVMMNGSASAPSISGVGASTTGFYWAATPSILTAIAGVNRLTHSATTWSLNSSNGGTLDIGGTSQYMDFGGTIVAGAAIFQGFRTTGLIWDMQVSRTSSFGLNNANTIGGSTGSLTLTTMTGARSGNVLTGSVGITITTSSAFEAREFNNGSSGTVVVTNNFGFNASQNMTTGAALNASFRGVNTANATRWNLYMEGSAQNWLAGNLGIGTGLSAPTAKLHISAGSGTAGTAQIKLEPSTLLLTPEDGAIEATSSHLYFTAGGVRYQLDQQAGGSGLSQAQVLTIASMRF